MTTLATVGQRNTARDPQLVDGFGRTIDYLRVSVTDRCDLRCQYCLPARHRNHDVPEDWLSMEEHFKIIGVFSQLGVRRIRLTGGEPLLRKDLSWLVHRVAHLPNVDDVSLSTNGTQLKRYAGELRQAGLTRLNVSLDSLNSKCSQQITGSNKLSQVIDGILEAKSLGFESIKVNMVVMEGINEHEVEHMLEFCVQHGLLLRLIEPMPIGATGRSQAHCNLKNVQTRLSAKFNLTPRAYEIGGGPARYWSDAAGRYQVGFITPMSQHFCATCNRVRLSVDGNLYLCLGQNDVVPLRDLVRGGDAMRLQAGIVQAIQLKPERHEFNEAPEKIVRFMAQTGG